MKIGIDARMYSSAFTGIGRYVYELSRRLFEIDDKNEYVLFFNSPEFQKFTSSNPRVSKRLVEARHYSFDEQTKFLNILNQENLDLMHFTHFNAPIRYKKPFIVTIHDLTLSYFPGKKMGSFIHRMAYKLVISSITKKAKKIIAVSYHTKKDLEKTLNIDQKKIQVIYEAAGEEFKPMEDAETLKLIKEKYNIDKNFILYTGVWRSHKNLTGLIKAFSKLLNDGQFDGYLVVTGREDPFYPEIKETVKSLDLIKNVIFTGLVSEEDLVLLYNAASVFALPSFYEGFGLGPLEAFSCGTPVAASEAACIPEVCGKNNAIFFDPNDISDMANKLFLVLSNTQLQNQLIKRGFLRARNFSWDKMAKETLTLYESLISS